MHVNMAAESDFGLYKLGGGAGLSISALPNGCIYRISAGGIQINQVLASPVAGGIQRLYLRILDGGAIRAAQMIGPAANSAFLASDHTLIWRGRLEDLDFLCECRLLHSGWTFRAKITNAGGQACRCDLVLVQDIGLAAAGQVRNNELFNAQYLDHFAAEHAETGFVVMSRQNLAQPGNAHPWLLQGCLPAARGITTDGFDFFGVAHRGDGAPAALGRTIIGKQIRQYEAAYSAMQSADQAIAPGRHAEWSFFAKFELDHPAASTAADLECIDSLRREIAALPEVSDEAAAIAPLQSVFQSAALLCGDELSGAQIGLIFSNDRRHEEIVAGKLHSFFYGQDARHVVQSAKELSVLRPHGHIMRAGQGYSPADPLLSVTTYASGVFASQLAMGNTAIAKLFSGQRDSLNLVRSSGLRAFVRRDKHEPWKLLCTPSAFEMALDRCTWLYHHRDFEISVMCRAESNATALTYEFRASRAELQFLICGEVCASAAEYESSPRVSIDESARRITITPDAQSLLGRKQPELAFHIAAEDAAGLTLGGDEQLFADGRSRRLPYVTLRTGETSLLRFAISGQIPGASTAIQSPPPVVARVQANPRSAGTAFGITDTLAWFARDAMVHLSTPRGLEQANGAAWGVRDVCQGPVEFLLSCDRGGVVRDIVRRTFSQQYDQRWDWPQWFMFPPFEEIQSTHAHGDVLIWPLKALCDYLEHADDALVLEEQLPYTDAKTFKPTARRERLLQHVDRLVEKMASQFLPGYSLPRFGDGDWDDSLQPADASLRDRMVSSWTTALMYQTLDRWSAAMQRLGQHERAEQARELARSIRADFVKHLMPGGVVAGFAIFAEKSQPRYLLHPSDETTGLRYRLIPMTRAIIGRIFSREQAEKHLALIQEHLLFPDGARLMDRPTQYAGGSEKIFRRSESAAFFGREIGLQYVHAHLRYAEALAAMGRADELLHALLVVNPILVTDFVKNARARQRNCFFSSSDAAFNDRYEAARDYEKLRRGETPVDGGWRIYSSGPGLYTNMIVRQMLGIRRRFADVEIDPVLPKSMAGISCQTAYEGHCISYEFEAGAAAGGGRKIVVNDVPIETFTPIEHTYRRGGVRIGRKVFESHLRAGQNRVRVEF